MPHSHSGLIELFLYIGSNGPDLGGRICRTYDEIIRKNRWGIQSLNTWNSVSVSLEDGKVKVVFPTISSDNINFFVNPVLPKHVVDSMDVNTYRNYFALAPITN